MSNKSAEISSSLIPSVESAKETLIDSTPRPWLISFAEWEQLLDALILAVQQQSAQEIEQQSRKVLTWLGYWRDQIPAKAVSDLQDVLGVPAEASLAELQGQQPLPSPPQESR